MSELTMEQAEACPNLLPYPVDLSPILALPVDSLDETRAHCNVPPGVLPPVDHPTSIAQYAIANWNAYLAHGGSEHREIFLTLADWLLAHKSLLSNGGYFWPVSSFSNAPRGSRPCLSSLTQGYVLSVLFIAHQLNG